MKNNAVAAAILVAALFVLYKVVIPRLFPSVVQKVGLVRTGADSNVVFAFDAPGVPLINNNNRSQVRATARRRSRIYEVAQA